jgi:hypothetical protein
LGDYLARVKYKGEHFLHTKNGQPIAELFDRDKSVISKHLKNIFEKGELVLDSVVAQNATTAAD